MIYEIDGRRFKSIRALADHYSLSYWTLQKRLKSGMPLQEAINIKPRNPVWTMESLVASAQPFDSLRDWRKSNHGAYQAWILRGRPSQVTDHMSPLGNRSLRCIYVISVEGTRLKYVGLTGDLNKRFSQHLRTKRFIEIANRYGTDSIKISRETEYIPADHAVLKEQEISESLVKQGFYLLNIAKAGSLGGDWLKWDLPSLLSDAQQYHSFKEWRLNSPSAYTTALSRNLIEQIIEKLGFEREVHESSFWTFERIEKSAREYSSKMEWYKNDNQAYHAAKRLGFFVQVTSHMLTKKKESKWSLELVKQIASKYQSRKDWRKHDSASYSAAQKYNWLDIACSHMKPNRKKWTIEAIIESARRYDNKSDWVQDNPSVDRAAKRLGCFEEATKHMIAKWSPRWTSKADVLEDAKRFHSKTEWQKRSVGAYTAALRYDWMEEASTHMKKPKSKVK